MANDQSLVPFEPFFGGFVLETLTIGMYGEARNAVREYIQNGFDSIQRAIDELEILSAGEGWIKIELATDHESLTIRDNGAGLPAKRAATVLARVGASSKSHHKNAGFRGIGRLAGIVFSDTVTFKTKAKDEREETTVIFNAKAMRDAMAPGKGSRKSAMDLMKESVSAFRSPSRKTTEHFFEVKLEGFTDEAPKECRSAQAMYDFVSQIAPVPYPADFPYRDKLRQEAERSGIPIEEVRITIKEGKYRPKPVTKRYSTSYEFDSGKVRLNDCSIYRSKTDRWWAWVGKKEESGAYTDSRVRGLRVRVRNIQIDDTAIVRDIFRDYATSSQVRFQDYFLGEVFIKPSALVPNARRDGFEEDAAWRRVRGELAEVVKALCKEAYQVSKKGQLSVDALNTRLKNIKKKLKAIQQDSSTSPDRIIKLSKSVTLAQSYVANALLGATMETAAELQSIGSALADIKQEALTRIGNAVASDDREKVQQEARDDLLQEILEVLEGALSPACFAEAQEALEVFDDE